MLENTKKNEIENSIAKTWISGHKSVTLILDRQIAEKYDLLHPSHVILEGKPEGILIRKLKV